MDGVIKFDSHVGDDLLMLWFEVAVVESAIDRALEFLFSAHAFSQGGTELLVREVSPKADPPPMDGSLRTA